MYYFYSYLVYLKAGCQSWVQNGLMMERMLPALRAENCPLLAARPVEQLATFSRALRG